jgi:hypothetical protein
VIVTKSQNQGRPQTQQRTPKDPSSGLANQTTEENTLPILTANQKEEENTVLCFPREKEDPSKLL